MIASSFHNQHLSHTSGELLSRTVRKPAHLELTWSTRTPFYDDFDGTENTVWEVETNQTSPFDEKGFLPLPLQETTTTPALTSCFSTASTTSQDFTSPIPTNYLSDPYRSKQGCDYILSPEFKLGDPETFLFPLPCPTPPLTATPASLFSTLSSSTTPSLLHDSQESTIKRGRLCFLTDTVKNPTTTSDPSSSTKTLKSLSRSKFGIPSKYKSKPIKTETNVTTDSIKTSTLIELVLTKPLVNSHCTTSCEWEESRKRRRNSSEWVPQDDASSSSSSSSNGLTWKSASSDWTPPQDWDVLQPSEPFNDHLVHSYDSPPVYILSCLPVREHVLNQSLDSYGINDLGRMCIGSQSLVQLKPKPSDTNNTTPTTGTSWNRNFSFRDRLENSNNTNWILSVTGFCYSDQISTTTTTRKKTEWQFQSKHVYELVSWYDCLKNCIQELEQEEHYFRHGTGIKRCILEENPESFSSSSSSSTTEQVKIIPSSLSSSSTCSSSITSDQQPLPKPKNKLSDILGISQSDVNQLVIPQQEIKKRQRWSFKQQQLRVDDKINHSIDRDSMITNLMIDFPYPPKRFTLIDVPNSPTQSSEWVSRPNQTSNDDEDDDDDSYFQEFSFIPYNEDNTTPQQQQQQQLGDSLSVVTIRKCKTARRVPPMKPIPIGLPPLLPL